MDSTTLTLLSIFGGVIVGGFLTGGFSLLSSSIQSRREHCRWLREARLTAFSDFLTAIDLFKESSTTHRLEFVARSSEDREALARRLDALDEEVVRAQSRVYLLGPDPIRVVCAEYHDTVLAYIGVVASSETVEHVVALDVSRLQHARSLMLAVMNRTLGIGPNS